MKSKDLESGSAESKLEGSENDDSGKVHYDGQFLRKTGNGDSNPVAENNSTISPRKRKKLSTQPRGRKYLLRSSGDGVRVLRSTSNAKCKIQAEPVTNPVNPVTKRRKKRRKRKTTTDDYSMARKRIRYLLNRMSYEQNLIDAYAGEGWKGQSAEKIRPEKELERAKSEILRCKLKIRDLFRHLDSLSSEGRFQESLFDSEGQIDSEDIFCAKCGLIDVSANNDIILCDGICDRGFHQKCLNPPLLSADIPVGDEGWLCPACDCKVDCLDLLNESQGSDISIEDTWEKVFPEAAAIANGDKQCDNLPSDDSEDYEYDPDRPEADGDDHEDELDHEEESGSEELGSEESEFTNSAEDSDSSERPKQIENFGLSSDDSDDDDFDPDVPDPDKVIQKDGSSSNESDFTSDSDDFCKELSKTSVANEDSASSLLKGKRCVENTDYSSLNSEVLSTIEGDLNEDNVLPSGKRQVERLDYRKLHDETYGKSSSDSSEDEDWLESADISTPKKRKKDDTREGSHVLSKANARNIKNKRSSRSDAHNLIASNAPSKSVTGQPHASQLEGEVGEEQHDGFQESDSNVNKSSTPVNRRLGTIASQKLYECFQENQYPTREKRESLAQEVGLTFRQVDKWFVNTRHSYRVSAKKSSRAGGTSPDKGNKSSNAGENNRQAEDVVGGSAIKEGKGENSAPSKNSEVRADESNDLGKEKNIFPTRNSEVGAENGNISDDAPGQSSSVKEGKGKKKILASRSKVSAENGDDRENNTEVTQDRQKAIARELRRMKQRR